MPPKLADKLLHFFLSDDRLEEVLGDLHEEYRWQVNRVGERRAHWRYWIDVIGFLKPFTIQRKTSKYPTSTNTTMLRNYLKIAWRSLWKNKASSSINVFGLTVGLTSCLLIGLYIQHELSFDTFQTNGRRVARVIMEYSFGTNQESNRGNFTSTKVAPVFVRTFPEVEASVRMYDDDMIVRYGRTFTTEPHFMFADSSFFRVFNAQFLAGNPSVALNGPHQVVVTESTAKKYFGTDRPLGKILLIGSDSTAYQVTGVLADYPTNSQIRFDFLASFSSLGANQEESYFDANYTTYLLLKDEHSFAPLQAKITPFMQKEMAGSGASINYLLEDFSKIHLHSEYGGFVPTTSITYLYILSGVAVLILLIVSFTYINLSTARSVQRAKEVGVRKAAGARRFQLFWQFIAESAIVCLIALLLSLCVTVQALPVFSAFIKTQLSADELVSPVFLLVALLTITAVSLLAGSYPAIVLSRVQPVLVLKGLFRGSGSGRRMQQSLIVFQFVISVALLVATFIIQRQLYFIQHKKLGYNRDHVLVLPVSQQMQTRMQTIKQELRSNPNILRVARCSSTPVHISHGYNMRSAVMPEKEQIAVTANRVDEDYIKTTGLQLVAGQDFTEQDINDVADDQIEKRYHFILNESAAKRLGWTPQQAIGQRMFLDASRPGVVKGVIRDFHFASMHEAIKPLVLFPEIRSRQFLVKMSGQHLPETLAFIETKWKAFAPDIPFAYRFLDDDYTKLYHTEHQLGTVMDIFSSIALVLTCLGLLGLSAYVVQQRTKEIGIRKVLGASVVSIVTLLSKDFLILVGISILIAWPTVWYAMNQWLADFAYRIDIEWWVFALAGALSIGIALLTVSFQSIKAALMNPVKSLRSE